MTTHILIMLCHFSEVLQKPPPQPQEVNEAQVAAHAVPEPAGPAIEASAAPSKASEEARSTITEKVEEAATSQETPQQNTESPRAETPHEESDFEDNITVTVPPPHLQSGNAFRDRHLNGRHGRHKKHSGGMDTPPKTPQVLQVGCSWSKIIR